MCIYKYFKDINRDNIYLNNINMNIFDSYYHKPVEQNVNNISKYHIIDDYNTNKKQNSLHIIQKPRDERHEWNGGRESSESHERNGRKEVIEKYEDSDVKIVKYVDNIADALIFLNNKD
jgi:hypothetical protein